MKKMISAIKRIDLIDKILIGYMIILFAYTAIHLFNGTVMQESTSVDTIVRTSASSIFGYFISNHFIKSNSDVKSKAEFESENENSSADTITIAQSNNGKETADEETERCCSTLQIIIVSGIGFLSLLLLFGARKYTQAAPEISATVSQLRDFLSACIGFLISCGKSK